MKRLVLSVLLLAATASASFAADAAFDEAKYNALLSKLESMGHGYYLASEWAQIDSEVADLLASAKADRNAEAVSKAAVVQAMTFADMRRDYPAALKALREARAAVKAIPGGNASQLYVKEADVLAQAGDRAAIAKLIAEYKASDDYVPEEYAWAGGNGPSDPLVIARPNATEKTSLPLTMMEAHERAAVSAPGLVFPDAELVAADGRAVRLADYRGKVLLVDFFVRGWTKWQASLPQLTALHAAQRANGFEVVSICLEPRAAGLESLGLPWTVCRAAPELTKPLGIFGESTNFLLDRNGTVIARGLYGSDLAFAVRRALGVE